MQTDAKEYLDVQPAQKTDQKSDQKTKRKSPRSAILVRGGLGTISSIILAFAIYLMAADSFWLRFVSPVIDGLSPIASVAMLHGTSSRKTLLDPLWLTLRLHQWIYSSDLVSTGEGDRIMIEVNRTLRVNVDPNSLVRIKLIDGSLAIRLSRGSISLESDSDQKVFVQRGAKIDEVHIKKGTYVVKTDSSFGVQLATFHQDLTMTNQKSVKRKAAAVSEAEDDIEDEGDEEESSAEPTQVAQTGPKFHLPTPADQAALFIKDLQPVLISPQAKCEEACFLQVFRNNFELRSATFKAGETPVLVINPSDLLEGKYSWVFKTATREIKMQFAIEMFSPEALARALEQGRPIEIY